MFEVRTIRVRYDQGELLAVFHPTLGTGPGIGFIGEGRVEAPAIPFTADAVAFEIAQMRTHSPRLAGELHHPSLYPHAAGPHPTAAAPVGRPDRPPRTARPDNASLREKSATNDEDSSGAHIIEKKKNIK